MLDMVMLHSDASKVFASEIPTLFRHLDVTSFARDSQSDGEFQSLYRLGN
jgi:hypothetical protein